MALGKKSQEKHQKVKMQTVAMSQNPLYMEQQESPLREILIAVATAVVAVFLFGLIVANFSYYSTGYDGRYDYSGSGVSADAASSSDGTDAYVPSDTAEDSGYTADETGSAQSGTVAGDSVTDPVSDPARTFGEDTATGYILEGSDVRYIAESELTGMTEEQLRHARNEIYARHGRRFDDAGLQSYFDSKDWYNGTVSPEDFTEASLSEVEKANIETIVAYESAKGYR